MIKIHKTFSVIMTGFNMKKLLTYFAAFFFSTAVFAGNGPTDVISNGSTKILNIIKQDNSKNTAQIMQQMENAAIPLFDFQRMTALAVGRGWRTATPAQQTALIKEFKSLLIKTYSGTMMRFKNANVNINSSPVMANNGNEATVKSVIEPGDGKKSVMVDYTLYNGSQGWKIFNVSVEGASLVTVYRNQFNDEINKNGIDGLIKLIKDRNSNAKTAEIN